MGQSKIGRLKVYDKISENPHTIKSYKLVFELTAYRFDFVFSFLSLNLIQVESRDTLNSIALKFDTTPNELVQLNKLFARAVVPGQVLLYYVCYLLSKDFFPPYFSSPMRASVKSLSSL